ncbi:MAG: metal ABC transporter substrate-binding protein [Burkholderiales bacterium]
MKAILLAVLLLFSKAAVAALSVFACEPEWAALAKELGGEKLEIYTATTALQDPHYIEARPSLIAKARSADLLICTGADLEVGWLPILLNQSGNARIQSGQPGYLEAARLVAKLEIPKRLDRALGDVHPQGNPHVHLDPRNLIPIAQEMGARLTQLDPANAEHYRERLARFLERWESAIARWEKDAAALKGVTVVSHHRNWSYLYGWLGMVESATLEPRPGIPPSPGHLSQLIAQQKANPAKMVIRAAYNDPKPSISFAERVNIPAVVLPYTVGGSDAAKDLFDLFEDSVRRLLDAA